MLAHWAMLISLVLTGFVVGRFCFIISNNIVYEKKTSWKSVLLKIFSVKNIKYYEFITQILVVVSYLCIYTQTADMVQMFLLCALSTCLVILIITDLKIYIIPDVIQFTMAIIGIFYAYFGNQMILKVIIMPIFCYGIVFIVERLYYFFCKKNALGMGDMKFFAVSGIFLPVESMADFFFLSGILGVLMAMIWRLLGNGKIFPFGPALATALYLCLVFPNVNYNFVHLH